MVSIALDVLALVLLVFAIVACYVIAFGALARLARWIDRA